MEFDGFTVTLLILRPDAPQLDEWVEDAFQDAHMTRLADLYESGHLPAAGPLLAGAMAFSPTRFPRSLAETMDGGSSGGGTPT